MNANTPLTRLWLFDGVVVTTVQENAETAITLTVTTRQAVDDPRTALATLAQTLQQTAHERKAVTA